MHQIRLTAIVLVATVLIGAAEASAGGRRHLGHSGFPLKNTTGSLSAIPVDPWKSWGVQHRGRVHGRNKGGAAFVPFFPSGGSTVVVSSPTTILYESGPGPFAGSPFVATAAVPPIAPLVEYAEGWYQLHGDGVTTPYRWIWIPRPPAPPVSAAPPATAAAPPANPEPARTGPRIGDAYQWTDEQGITSWTNRPDRIPPRFRDQAVTPGPDAAPR